MEQRKGEMNTEWKEEREKCEEEQVMKKRGGGGRLEGRERKREDSLERKQEGNDNKKRESDIQRTKERLNKESYPFSS